MSILRICLVLLQFAFMVIGLVYLIFSKDLPKIEQAIKDSSDEKNSAKKFRIDQGGGGCGKFPVNLELERYLREKFMEDHYSKGLSLSVTRKIRRTIL